MIVTYVMLLEHCDWFEQRQNVQFSILCFHFDITLTDIITIATKADRPYTGLTRFNKQVRFHCFQNINQKAQKMCVHRGHWAVLSRAEDSRSEKPHMTKKLCFWDNTFLDTLYRYFIHLLKQIIVGI